jgi:peptide chain release factor 1
MHQAFRNLIDEYERLEQRLADPDVTGNPDELRRVAKAHAELERSVQVYREYEAATREREDNVALLQDADDELAQLIREETERLNARIAELDEQLRLALLPRDPDADKNVIMEIRAGTGGAEAALFARDLYNMYSRLAEKRGWETEMVSLSEAEMGGIKEIVIAIEGDAVYRVLKHESGVHRVQRVPVTESGGRLHTSAATVAVLPEPEELDVRIDPNDLEIKATIGSGPGGQSVQKNATAIRVKHLPTGIIVYSQDERSQRQNKEKALRVLRSRLYEMERQQQQSQIDATRRQQVKSGDRSEKIRTYNFPQSRVTDHRIGYTTHNLHAVLDGELEELIGALLDDEEQQLLAQLSEASPSGKADNPAS